MTNNQKMLIDGITGVVGREELTKSEQAELAEIYSNALWLSRAIPRSVLTEMRDKMIHGRTAIVDTSDSGTFYENFQEWVTEKVKEKNFHGLYFFKGTKSVPRKRISDKITIGFTEEDDYKNFEIDFLLPAKLAKK